MELGITLHAVEYALDVAMRHWVKNRRTIDWIERVITFNVSDVPQSTEKYPYFASSPSPFVVRGFVRSSLDWEAPVRRSRPIKEDRA